MRQRDAIAGYRQSACHCIGFQHGSTTMIPTRESIMNRLFAIGCILMLSLRTPVLAEKEQQASPAVQKLNRDNPRHKEFLKRIELSKGAGNVIFLGDSITQGWEGKESQKVWHAYFDALKPLNLGIGGDQTGHVLWRITDGKELEHLQPKLAVIMIGTNNTRSHSAEQIAAGIKAIVEELKKQKPSMKILVLGVFPRGNRNDATKETKTIPAAKLNMKVPAINAVIASLDDGKTVFYKDIGKQFLDKDGGLSAEIMPDYLHLSPKGYEIWARAIKGDMEKLVK
jgi:lysophospholipase L1-like esterase